MTDSNSQQENKDLAEQNTYDDFDYTRDSNLSYAELLEKYKSELYHFQFVRKKEIVNRMAETLEREGTPKETIAARISEDLKGYDISDRYIRECLGEEYTQKSKRRERFAEVSSANNSTENEKPAIITTTNGHASYDEEMKNIYANRDSPLWLKDNPPSSNLQLLGEIKDKNLKIGQLEEQLQEQKQQIQELIKSVNTQLDMKKDKPVAVTESLEYKNVVAHNQVLEQRIVELEEIVKKSIRENPAVGFQSASKMSPIDTLAAVKQENNPSQNQPINIRFPANILGKFFLQSRNVKDYMILKLDDKGNVEGWEVK